MCYYFQEKYTECLSYCKKAIDNDSSNLKAWYYKSKCLLNSELYEEAIESLKMADQITKKCCFNVGDDISSLMRQARRLNFEQKESQRKQDLTDMEQKLSLMAEISTDSDIKSSINNFIQTIKVNQTKEAPPDAFFGKISFEIMKDPVISPSGTTYDKKNILEHLSRVGHFDPLTRQKLTADQLIPNYALKEIIEEYLEKNPWAEEY